jgi:hypothetical protein
VKIDDVDVPLAFDSGDRTAVILSQRVLDRVKHLPMDEVSRSMDVKGNLIQSETFKLPLLLIGGARFTDVVGHSDVHDPSYPDNETVDHEGRFGTSLLKSYKVVLDYAHHKMTLISTESAGSKATECRGAIVPFLPDWNGDPVTKATTEFGQLTAVWDTGAPVSILRKAGGQDIGGSVLTDAVTAKHFRLGGADFGPLRLVVANYAEPAGTDMFVGYNFFANHIVCIDFPGHRFLIRR